ncbi:multiple epidermal growth factor-like domains protein 10 [Crassostrea angulata]|uniref:multiple epidermal growth factor-like domains protein 10 n=1 Tax=Magallana angulata TaxID=2784310 RepID=UPI0022B083C4|nr:multiple epidermal growth factor-like domains protein 10 [Crassostrea angulata]
MQTNAIGVGTSFRYRTVWWRVDLGEVHNIYSIKIQFKNYNGYVDRQRGRFAGFSLYVSHSDVLSNADIKGYTLCYKDGAQLPPLNFTAVCTVNGRYVIYYNERLHGDTYPDRYEFENVFTELCEVIVLGCNNASVYGKNCDTPCPLNCKDSTCHIKSGSCFTCKLGWIGIYCEAKCKEGWYGANCSQQCERHCRDGATCNQVTGHCDRGCEAGWTGDMCDKVCDEGYYGYNCVNTCSGHCLDSSPCNKQTGHCDKGCNSGYRNSDCSRDTGYFGMDCMEKCSGHCINHDPCDHVSGVCPSGCQEGYIWAFCNNTCTHGYYGTNCSRVCSPNCKPDTCRHTDGGCYCSAGWMGYNCTTECMLSYGENCRYPCSFYCFNQTCDKFNGSCLHSCKYGWQCDTENII